jgi:siroheme synthase
VSVAIVGAGPGDPGLVTVRALELVRDCEILIYDRLVSIELVSKAVGAARIAREGMTQEEVCRALVHYGLRGRKVVRLKGGDPFIFGRGAEEVEALVAGPLDPDRGARPRGDPADGPGRLLAADRPDRHLG